MAIKTLSNTGIATGQTVQAAQVSQSINAFTATDDYRIKVSGSFVVTGSLITFGPTSATNFVRFPNVAGKIATGSVGTVGIDPAGNLYSSSIASGTKGQKGEAGTAGPKGQKGESGSKGQKGEVGPKGSVGPQGNQGPKGQKGQDGSGGTKGPAGDKGAQGDQGASGPKGSSGPAGPTGPAGPKGANGPKGSTGTKGSAGPAGTKGSNGPKGSQGDAGPAGPKGQKGEASSVAGPKGQKGADGPAGPSGPKGQKGEAGPTGPQGAQGNQGPAGPKGQKGADSSVAGPTGPAGDKGAQGDAGPTGPKGQKGADSSVAGPKGQKGENGPNGPKGQKGEIGGSGPKGSEGPAGPTGPKGATGTSAGTSYNNQITYKAKEVSNQHTITLTTTGNLYSGLSWSRSSTTITVTSTAHGLSTGDYVVLRNMSSDYTYVEITNTGANTFTATVADSGDTSGTAGAYVPACRISSITGTTDITAATIAAPAVGNVRINNFLIFAQEQSEALVLTMPTGLTNGNGYGSDQLIAPIFFNAKTVESAGTAGGLTVGSSYSVGSNQNQITLTGMTNGEKTVGNVIF